MTRLLLLRHGQSTWNAVGRWQGWADPPLSPLGEAQARQAADHLATLGLGAVASSDLARARRTAELLTESLGLGPVTELADLRERNVGAWSGLTLDEIEAGWPGVLADYRSGRFERPPGGEDSATLVARATRGLSRLATLFHDRTVLTVTHGGVIRSLERSLGAEPAAGGLSNLCGRWFEWTGGSLRPLDGASPLDDDLVAAPPT